MDQCTLSLIVVGVILDVYTHYCRTVDYWIHDISLKTLCTDYYGWKQALYYILSKYFPLFKSIRYHLGIQFSQDDNITFSFINIHLGQDGPINIRISVDPQQSELVRFHSFNFGNLSFDDLEIVFVFNALVLFLFFICICC